ncbi:MAG: hypothetical protein DRJ32_04655 [Thermoprotei archaeon]|nr:MAG: hypothetical protein DRJ32_04655 [Thermoprotei archaeon]HDD64291.1 hypothetical protein [Thermoprotei archaeon]
MPQRLKLLLGENIGIRVYEELRRRGFDVQSIMLERRGAEDAEVIKIARVHNKVIVTMDKDFGYLAVSQTPPGLILLRPKDLRIPNRLRTILRALELGERLYGYITVVTETIIRRRPINP